MKVLRGLPSIFSNRTFQDLCLRVHLKTFIKLNKNKSSIKVKVGSRRSELNHRGTLDDLFGIWQCFGLHQYEIPRPFYHEAVHKDAVQNFYNSLVIDGKIPLVLDCGANIGAASVWFLERYPAAHLVAVEPVKSNLEVLKRNLAGRSADVVDGAVFNEDCNLTFVDTGSTLSNRVKAEDGTQNSTFEVKGYSIDTLISSSSKSVVPFVLKLDIEGSEEHLFDSSIEIFKQFPVIIIEPHDFMYPGKSVTRRFLKFHSENHRDFLYGEENIFSIDNRLLL